MTTLDVNESDSLKTLSAAYDCGVNFFDTAFAYGANGESERLIARALGGKRDSVVIATKCGLHWNADREREFDGSPKRLKFECEESLRRLSMDYVDLLYLHAPDPRIPVQDSAVALKEMLDAGKARCIGVSNFNVQQLEEFSAVCPVSVVQPPYNMLQRDIEADLLPWCQANDVACVIYWPLMKGLLAGKLKRDHVFGEGDGRPKYPMYQGDEWLKNHDLVDELRAIASDIGKTVAQLVVAWTIAQPGITSALCGAKRDHQIQETADALAWKMDDAMMNLVNDALSRRGAPKTRPAV